MKIEKISNNQIRIVLTGSDLKARNISLADLPVSSERIKNFFREMMEEAVHSLNFKADNIPLMVEAVPIANEGVMLIVSKVEGEAISGEMGFNILPSAFTDRSFVRVCVQGEPERLTYTDEADDIYSFDSLDDASRLCRELVSFFDGCSILYKSDGLYYLALSNDVGGEAARESFDALVLEYGTKHISGKVARAYLDEHGEVIVAKNAVEVLGKL